MVWATINKIIALATVIINIIDPGPLNSSTCATFDLQARQLACTRTVAMDTGLI